MLFSFSDTAFFTPPHNSDVFSLTPFHIVDTFSLTADIPFFIFSNPAFIPSHALVTIALTFSHRLIQKFRNPSDLFHNTINAPTNAPIATMTIPIGFAVIATFNAHCAAVEIPITTFLAVSAAFHNITAPLYVIIAPATAPITGDNASITDIAPLAKSIAVDNASQNVDIPPSQKSLSIGPMFENVSVIVFFSPSNDPFSFPTELSPITSVIPSKIDGIASKTAFPNAGNWLIKPVTKLFAAETRCGSISDTIDGSSATITGAKLSINEPTPLNAPVIAGITFCPNVLAESTSASKL